MKLGSVVISAQNIDHVRIAWLKDSLLCLPFCIPFRRHLFIDILGLSNGSLLKGPWRLNRQVVSKRRSSLRKVTEKRRTHTKGEAYIYISLPRAVFCIFSTKSLSSVTQAIVRTRTLTTHTASYIAFHLYPFLSKLETDTLLWIIRTQSSVSMWPRGIHRPFSSFFFSFAVLQLMLQEAPQPYSLLYYPPYWTFRLSPPVPRCHAP
jgi:hypothetical protein